MLASILQGDNADAITMSALGGYGEDIEECLAQRGDVGERRLGEQAPAFGLGQLVELLEEGRDQRRDALALEQADE